MRVFVAFWILMMINTAVFAGNIETVIVPPVESPQSGQMAEFFIYVHNIGGETVSLHLPVRLSCRIESTGRNMEAVATAVQPFQGAAVALGKNNFMRRRYAFTVPEGFEGPVRMDVRELSTTGVMFVIAAIAQPTKEVAADGRSRPSEDLVTLDSLFTLSQPYLVNMGAYEPIYFLAGTDPKKSKFQISFKYRLLNSAGALAEHHPWLNGLHLGYTQTSFWDLKSNSAPFEDTSYKPEFFFLSPNINARPSWMRYFFVQTGLQHESNGRGEEFSRSTNFFYAKPIFIFSDPGTRYGLLIAPKTWTYINNDEGTNPDLKDYRGCFELEMKLGKVDSFGLGSYFRWAEEGASVQLDLTYPLHRFLFHNANVYFHVQYVNTLAESLLNFRERTEALRFGFSIVR